MKRWNRCLASVMAVFLVVAVVVPVGAQDEALPTLEPLTPAPMMQTGEMLDETPQHVFIELTSPPTADGTSLETVQGEKANFRATAKQAGITFSERYAYDTLFNGLSIEVPAAQIPALSRLSGVKAIWPVVTVARPETILAPDEEPNMETALAMTGADIAQSELGFTGAGVKVAVMDTGIDYNHPDLGGCFGPGCRVAMGYDFVGDAFDNTTNFTPVPDLDPDDCVQAGHGTHVAGIIGANGKVRGVAPNVTFGAYRVFGCTGSTTADIMIAAMERVLADGMQVLNMSIGSAFQWPNYPTGAASNRLVNKGVTVVASIGNSGANGAFSAGSPGLGEKVIGVASFDNTHVSLNTFTISPDNQAIGYSPASGAPTAPTTGSYPMARTGTATSTADACSALPAGSLTGKIVLIRRGSCTFYTKSMNAQRAGAVGVVLYNNSPGRFSATVAGSPAITIPVVSVSDKEGVLINNRLASGPVTMTFTDQFGKFLNPTGGLISSFSSYGLSPDLSLKPDIGAPGGLIRSTYPLEAGGYATLSGTSMSSPHVAGAVALLLEAKPHTPSQAVRSILQNSAQPKKWWGNPGLGFLDNVHRQGAGMLNIAAAIESTAKVEPGKLSLGESEAGPATRTLTIENNGATDVTYALGHQPALSSRGTFTVSFTTGFASATFSADTVTVPAGGTATVDVTITANAALADGAQYGGYITLTPQDGGAALRVPYAGFKGDYQAITALAPTSFGFPWLARAVGTSYAKQSDGAVFTLQNGDLPYLLVHLDHHVRLLRAELVDAKTGKSWHRIFNEEYVGRSSTNTAFDAYVFDGVTQAGNKLYTVPNGEYVIVLSALKAMGDESNPAHWESWTSPRFTIRRP